MKKLLLLFLLLAETLQAQTYFNNRYGNNGNPSGATAIAVTSTGYAVVGRGDNNPNNGYKALMLRLLDQQGQQLSVKYYGKAGYDEFPCASEGLINVSSGGFAMAGTRSFASGPAVATLWRFNAQSDTLWTRTYSDSMNIAAYACRETTDGGFVIVGLLATSATTGASDALLIRTDSLGNELWRKTYGTRLISYASDIEATPDGGYIIGGWTYNPQAPLSDAYVVKVDSIGNLEWDQAYGTNMQDGSALVKPSAFGGYILSYAQAMYISGGDTFYRTAIGKLDSQGSIIWQVQRGPISSGPQQVHELSDGRILVGSQRNLSGGGVEAYLLMSCHSGDSLWYRPLRILTGPLSHNYLRDVQPTADGGFVAAGFIIPVTPDVGSHDSWVFKTDSLGCLHPGCAAPVTVCPRIVAVPEVQVQQRALLQIYPNPTTGLVQLEYHLPEGVEQAQVQVRDGLGRTTRTLTVSGHSGQGSFDLSGLPSGLYFYTFSTGEKVLQAGKLVKLP